MDNSTRTIVENIVRSFSLVKTDIMRINNYLAEMNDNAMKSDIDHSRDSAYIKKEQRKILKEVSKLKDQNKAMKAEIRFLQRKVKSRSKRK